MRMALFAGAAVLAGFGASAVPAAAAPTYPWCARYSSSAGECSFQTFEQCQADIAGIGGGCTQNPAYSGPALESRGPYNYVPPRRATRREPSER
jgi:Protein of unknown function (DUF3551)